MSVVDDFKDDVDWDLYNSQQNPDASGAQSAPAQASPPSDAQSAPPQQAAAPTGGTDYHQDMPIGPQSPGKGQQGQMIDTFLGKFPDPRYAPKHPTPETEDQSKKMMDEMINAAAGGAGMKVVGEIAGPALKAGASKAMEYMHPEREAEKFRSTIGEGTSTENIDDLAKRIQFAKNSAKEEALIPKRELYAQEGKSDVFNVDPKNLPEGNIPQMAHMIAPGEKFSADQGTALSKALADYRKTGNVEGFLDKSEDIFNVGELPEKAASKIEDALLMPTTRDSKYFADEDVASFYGKKGEIKSLHDKFAEKPTLNNYDALQSAIKAEQRKLNLRSKAGTITDVAEAKLNQFNENIKNLNADKENFMQTLPDKMQNLENDFRQKYATGVGKYEAAPLAMRKLADGRSSEVTPAQISKLFTNPTAETKKILLDLGPSAGKNILYNALQKVPLNDSEGMANTLLDLKRTKGYDQFVSKDMEDWANNMLKHVGRVSLIKKTLGAGAAATAGGMMMGPVGAMAGLAAPWTLKGAKYLAERLRK